MLIIETLINRYLTLDPELPAKLEVFDGKRICLDITGTGQRIMLQVQGEHVAIEQDAATEADAILRGSPIALFKMSMMRDVAPLLLQGDVEIIGDMRLGRAFKALLAEMQIDWEEHLSGITGDVIAHEFMKSMRSLTRWGKRTGESLAMDVGEYLTEETRDVITGAELEDFNCKVDTLRMDAERLEARIQRMTQRLSQGSAH